MTDKGALDAAVTETVIVGNQVKKATDFEGAVMVAPDGGVYRIINSRWVKVADAPSKALTTQAQVGTLRASHQV